MIDNTQNISANNKRIAKNTLLLYGRMLIMMLIGLYTSRVNLNALGVEDYGIYNVVGGVVAMFSVLSGSLSSAISRFITFELGKEDLDRLKKVFSTAINVQLILIAFIVILLETVGLWFLNYKMVIPAERLTAANWVFQFSVITFAINLWSVPYNSAIIAHEKMSAFAYISIFDAIAKLAIAFLILYNPFDRLVYFAILALLCGLFQRYLYKRYCTKHFEECKYHFIYDKTITKEIFGFAGWNFIGASSAILRDQGGNMIINIFYGPTVNAARGIAMTINSAVSGFVSNFQTALNPQITKNYAIGNYEYMFSLIFQGARLSFYIFLILALPIFFTTPYLINLWLGVVPEYTVNFCRLVMIHAMSDSLASPLIVAMLATGNIRNYQIIVGGIQMLNLPFSYSMLYFGYPPESVFVVAIFFSLTCQMARIVLLRRMINLSARAFIKDVYLNVIIVCIISSIIPCFALKYIGLESIFSFILILGLCVLSAICVIYTIGCNKNERILVQTYILNFIQRFEKCYK